MNNLKTNKLGELIVSSDLHRTQLQNHHDCVLKLYTEIVIASQTPVESDPESLKRVLQLAESADLKRKRAKMMRSKKKSTRSGRGDKPDSDND